MPHNHNGSTQPGNRVASAGAQNSGSQSNGARSNAILNTLSESQLAQLLPRLKIVELELGHVLYEPEQTIDYVYFPTAGIISLLALFEDGDTVEAGVIGAEGMLGTPVVLGAKTTPHQALVQATGQAMRMSVHDLNGEVEKDGWLLWLAAKEHVALHQRYVHPGRSDRRLQSFAHDRAAPRALAAADSRSSATR